MIGRQLEVYKHLLRENLQDLQLVDFDSRKRTRGLPKLSRFSWIANLFPGAGRGRSFQIFGDRDFEV
jgi:hypothetical protein